MARNNVQTTVTVGMDVQLAKRNAEALKDVIATLKRELKETRTVLENPGSYGAAEIDRATEAVKRLTLQIQTLQKVQRSATPAAAYEAYISGDVMNSNKLRQAQRGAKNRLNTVPSGASDQTARTLINDINRVQVELNRLQAGFQKPLQSVKKELRDLSGNELQRLLQLLKQEQTLVQGNDKAWAAYAAAIGKVEERMREYDTLARQQMGASTLSRSQKGGFAQANERDIQRAIDKLKEYRAVINDPKGSGKATFEATNAEIQKLQANLDALKQKELEASGQAVSLITALRTGVQSMRGTFQGDTQQLTLAKKALEENLLTATKGSAAYNGMKRALNAINLELQRTGVLTKEVQAVLDAPKGKSFNELKIAVEQGRAALQNMRRTTEQEKKDFDELAAKVKAADIEMKSLGASSKGTASSFDKAWSRLKTYIGLYMGAAVAIQRLTATMGDLMELSDKMGEVRKTTGFTADEVGRLSNELRKMDTRTALTGLMDLSVAAGQLGLKTEEDVLGFTEAANKLMVALPEMGKEGATEMLKVALATGEIEKIRRQMEQGLIDGSSATAVAMEKVGSTIDRLRATSAATAPAITDFVKRVGAVGAQSGISIDQVAALGSTVDALGMRVEMSATALSRMMPAIRNNAFDIAKILGITPDTIRKLYDTGQGMEVILMILQRMKDSNMDADSIEQMLGMGGMKEIMKELNQQGARAGIVFGGLSQNVDELRRQLGVAKQAYEENIAIQQEYDKMNETTAAKWERLKNEIEEAFVGDTAQRLLGGLIDVLRGLVNLLTGNVGPALGWITVLLKTFIAYWAALKIGLGEALFVKTGEGLVAMGNGLRNLISHTQQYIVLSRALRNAKLAEAAASTAAEKAIAAQSVATIKAKMAQEGLNKAMIANIWTAVLAAVLALGFALYRYIDSMREAGREAAKFQAELDKEQRKVNDLTNSIGAARVKIEDANKEVAKARAELDAAKKANDGTTESVNRLAKAESELLVKEEAKKNAMAAEKQLITEFNNQYSKYLGFMLSEVSSNLELARARDLVNSKLRETLTLKRQEAAIERVEKDMGGDRDKAYGKLYDSIAGENGLVVVNGRKMSPDPTQRPRIMAALAKAANSAKDRNAFIAQTKKIFKDNKYPLIEDILNRAVSYYDQVKNVRDATDRVIEQNKGENAANRQISQGDLILETNASFSNYNRLLRKYRGSKGDNRARNAAAVLQQMDMLEDIRTNASTYYDMTNPKEAALYRKQFGAVNAWKGYDRNTLLKEAGRYYTPRKKMQPGGGSGSGGSFTTSNQYTSGYSGDGIWGNDVDAASTDYSTWDVNELVARRNQMNKFKNVLKPGIEVRKVLAEDKALMKAIDEGKVGEDWQSVLDWYNAERKKIQQELKSERFSTNEGNWRDEATKKGKKRANPLLESDYALAELDRYYSRRKEALEKARSEENISEELYNRQLEMLEQEHLERRSKLRGTFTGEVSKAETKAFRKWWEDLEKMDELDHVPWATVESEWSKATAEQIWRNNLKMQQDMTQMESITMKHVNAIAKIIAKERPYDAITDDLQANLTKMDILFADLGTVTKKQLEDGSLTKELSRRLSFLLGEAEHAYSLNAEQLMSDMGEKGFKAWADAIASAENSEELKRQLLAQLQAAYDAVQDAIKKEANLIKKQAEIQWNDAAMPNGKSQRQNYESVLSALGLREDQVKRANQLIAAGQASERVADKLAIRQMQIRLAMQEQYYALIYKIGQERIKQLEDAGKLEDAEHLRKSLNLSLSEEQKKLDEQRVAIQNQLEESQNRLYTELKSWADLFGSSLQSLFEASHAGDPEYYNERAKLNLTGKGGPGAGTYVITDRAGTSGAKAHYEYLDDRAALERQREIERQNALADAWRKVMDDINMKMNDMITDQINAMLQNAAIDTNTTAVNANTEAIGHLSEVVSKGLNVTVSQMSGEGFPAIDENNPDTWPRAMRKRAGLDVSDTPHDHTQAVDPVAAAQVEIDASNAVTDTIVRNEQTQVQATKKSNNEIQASTQSAFAKMTMAANLYGVAYQAMSNNNLSTAQKFQMIALQAVGNGAIAALTTNLAQTQGEVATQLPGILGKAASQLGPIAGPIAFAALSALLGGLMGMAVSKIAKSKSQIAQVTGASIGAGRLTTGMFTYAEGNVNEFTDPSTLTVGRQYNVDAADGRTYRARYMGRNPKTHITNGPEFHLVGERGREAIIDAQTTRQLQMDDNGIWKAIQTLYNGGSIGSRRRRTVRRGVHAFAEGNMDQFVDMDDMVSADNGGATDQMLSLQASIDRQSDLLEDLRKYGIKAHFDVYGKGGLIDSYDTGKKIVSSHGEKH
ncbi:MAG: phage tail tape measure protein [Bacteroidaceae bacterium]|nr:phage tail tape measure protein [Bacteroidaceae bacterium]